MGDGVDSDVNSDWRSPEKYAPMLALDRRALAWQCLSRDQDFLAAAAAMPPPHTYIMRDKPPIVVASLSDEGHLASWGLLFRTATSPGDGGGLCRLAS